MNNQQWLKANTEIPDSIIMKALELSVQHRSKISSVKNKKPIRAMDSKIVFWIL